MTDAKEKSNVLQERKLNVTLSHVNLTYELSVTECSLAKQS